MVGFLVNLLLAAVVVSITQADPHFPIGFSNKSSIFPPSADWDVTVGTTTCIQSRMGVQLEIQYRHKDNATARLNYNFFPNQTRVTGSCNYETQTLVLKTAYNELQLQFGRDAAKGIYMWFVEGVTVHLKYESLPDAFPDPEPVPCVAQKANLTALRTRYGTSTVCTVADFVLDVTCGVQETLVTAVTMTLYEFQLEAFRRGPIGHFSRPALCYIVSPSFL
jgi:hypothetical protein